jgi:HK97 gp10 family phage protein
MADNFQMARYRLYRKMTKKIPEAAKRAANAAVVEGANEVAALQKYLAPEDDGDLKDSIHVTLPGQTTPPYSQPGGSQRARENQALITAGDTNVRYAHLVEYGTRKGWVNKGLFSGTTHPPLKAQPFFFPAWRALRQRARGRITRAINKAVKDGAK